MSVTQNQFVLYEMPIISATDGDWHFISGDRLIHLYGLNRMQCRIIPWHQYRGHMTPREHEIELRPRYLGDYADHLESVLSQAISPSPKIPPE